jgi:hypothetical protein
MTMQADIVVCTHGTVVTFIGASNAGLLWLRTNTSSEPWQWSHECVTVEHRYAQTIVNAADKDGMVLGRSS